MWDTRVVNKVEEAVGRFSVSCRFTSVSDQFVWAFTGIYGPNSVRDSRFLWEELFGLNSWWNVPWCVGGDFNVVRFLSERSSPTSFTAAMREFFNFISKQGLIDIPLQEGSFTWFNTHEVALKARLDRFLFSAEWEDKFSSFSQQRLPRLLSNHFPIVLEGGAFQRGRRPFRFENMWLKN